MASRRTTLLLLLVVFARGAAQDGRVLMEFDGDPLERFSVEGSWSIERHPERVRSGSGALRLALGPPAKYPKLVIADRGLSQARFRELALDVGNPSEEPLDVWIRLDDRVTENREKHRVRRKFTLAPGWTTLTFPLDELKTPSGRRLDPNALARFMLYLSQPATEHIVLVDRLRFERQRDDAPDAARVLKRFVAAMRRDEVDIARRFELVHGLMDVDVPGRVRVLDRYVLRDDDHPVLVEEAIRVLANTRDEEAVDQAIRGFQRSRGPRRFRWMAVLGRMQHPRARATLVDVAREGRAAADRAAAITALARRDDPGFVRLLENDDDPAWQVRRAKVRALRYLGTGDGFPALTGYLDDPSERVSFDAQRALAALSGRDLGKNVAAWLEWWRVNKGRLEAADTEGRVRNPYGSYYGIPLLPGKVAFVIDVSGSMMQKLGQGARAYVAKRPHLATSGLETRLDLAKAELIQALRGLPKKTRMQVIWFENSTQAWSKRYGALAATPGNKADAIDWVRNLNANGGTNLFAGLERAFVPDEDWPLRRLMHESVDTIFLLTDGAPSVGLANPIAILARVREMNLPRQVTIHTIGIGVDDTALLEGLARDSGGRFLKLAR